MKKKYEEPEIAIQYKDIDDVIKTSNPSMSYEGDGKWDNEDYVDNSEFFQ